MPHKVLSKNASMLNIGGLTFTVEDGRLRIQATHEGYQYLLSSCDTLALLNLMTDFKIETILVAREEQRERERRNKERQGHKKPRYIQVDGQWVEAVEVVELEKEQNE